MKKKVMAGLMAGLFIASISTGFAATQDPFCEPDYLPVDRSWKAFENQTKVKGIYVTGNVIGYNKKFDQLLELAVTTEVNAMIIDVNNDNGHFTYPTRVPMAVAEGLDNAPLSPKFSVNWDRLKAENIYTVARFGRSFEVVVRGGGSLSGTGDPRCGWQCVARQGWQRLAEPL